MQVNLTAFNIATGVGPTAPPYDYVSIVRLLPTTLIDRPFSLSIVRFFRWIQQLLHATVLPSRGRLQLSLNVQPKSTLLHYKCQCDQHRR